MSTMDGKRGNKKQLEGNEQRLTALQDAYFEYIELSKLLFGSKSPMYDINELQDGHKFFKPAKEISRQLEIDWDKMTHEDSNRIMLALLEDYYVRMAEVTKTRDLYIVVNFKIGQN